MTILKAILAVSVLALSLTACGDKNKTPKDTSTQKATTGAEQKSQEKQVSSQQIESKSEKLLSDKSTAEDFAKALVGTWESCSVDVIYTHPNTSFKTIATYGLTPKGNAVYTTQDSVYEYNNLNCEGKGKLMQQINSKDYPNEKYTSAIKIESKNVKGMDNDFVYLEGIIFAGRGAIGAEGLTQKISRDGNKLITYNDGQRSKPRLTFNKK